MCKLLNPRACCLCWQRLVAEQSYEEGVKLLNAFMKENPIVPSRSETGMDPSEHGATILRVEKGVDIPQLGSAPLFIRSFYDDCISGVMNNFDPTVTASCRRFIIIGNPGGELSCTRWCSVPCTSSCARLEDHLVA